MLRPGGTTWEGAGADAAAESSWGDLVKVRGAVDGLHAAAGHATHGSGDVAWAKRQVLNAIAEAEQDGFTVGQDFSVKDTRMPSLLLGTEDRQSKATEHAHDIQAAVQTLVAADKQAGARIRSALAPLEGLTFPEHGGNGAHVSMVDNRVEKPGDGKDKPGEKPSGAADPNGLASLMLPPEKPDDAKKPDPGKSPANAMDLIAAEQAKRDAAGKPPAPTQAPAVKIDPNSPEGKAAIATLRQTMVNEGKLTPTQIDQQINAALAGAQNPLPPPVHGADGPKPPTPSYSDGFRDAWNSTGDAVHALTGQDGFDKFKETWKNLGEGINNTVTNPVGTLRDEYEAFKANPEYWLGQKGFDATAGAATLPFGGGEGALARGALTHGLEHEVVHEAIPGPAAAIAHDAVPPVAPHTPVDVPHVADHGLSGHGGDASPPTGADHSVPTHSEPSPTGHLPETGDPGSFGYDADGNRMPYANDRPHYGSGQVVDVWNQSREAQIGQIDRGELNLPRPGPDQQWVPLHPEGKIGDDWAVQDGHRLIEWKPGDPRRGLWDMGHLPGQEYGGPGGLRDQYLRGEISYDEFMHDYRNPENYQVQDPYRNQSHYDEER